MCGEHQNASRLSHGPLGSSPHVRGALRPSATIGLGCGIIPACAGSTLDLIDTATGNRDHPRMCGEHATPRTDTPDSTGIIPACAGSTSVCFLGKFLVGDHPRMCGEHISTVGCHDVKAGSSPHVRGARGLLLPRGIVLGIIPACAGSTSYLAAIFHLPRDHPRMCGEHRNIIACICVSLGSSPHVRGAQKHCRHRRGVPGIIPACAGSTIRFYPECGGNGDHPRMCGEHSLSINHAGTPVGSSPHVRGAPLRKRGAVGIRRIIPACAGSTCWWRCCCPCWWDHPRMCGEHSLTRKRSMTRPGSSPHVRGALVDSEKVDDEAGIIPACAGSTPPV